VVGKDDHELAALDGFLELDVTTSLRDDFKASAAQGAQDALCAEQPRH